MNLASIIEALGAFLGLLKRFNDGDAHAAKKLRDILPAKTYTRLVREQERAKDKAKFG